MSYHHEEEPTMTNIHPLMVHFPIALLFSGLFLELLGWFFKSNELQQTAKWNLWLGMLGALAAVSSGLWAEAIVEHSEEVHGIMELHKILGLTVLGISIVLAGWRLIQGGTSFPKSFSLFVLTYIVMLGVMSVGAYLGGRMVYEYGVGGKMVTLQGGHEHSSPQSPGISPVED